MTSGGGVGADVTPAQAAGVGEGMLDATDSPAFVIQHQVVDDAADGQFRVFFDRIVLEVFVASIAVQQKMPVGIAIPDTAAQGEAHGGAFHIEGFVIFDRADGLDEIDVLWLGRDGFEEKAKAEGIEEIAGLPGIGAVAEIEGEGLQAGRADSEAAQDMIGDEEDGTGIDATAEGDGDGFAGVDGLDPGGDFGGQGADVLTSDFVEVRRQAVSFWGKEPGIDGIWIRAADELDFDDVMGWDHAGVRGVELIGEAFALELGVEGVHAVGDDQGGAFGAFGEEVAHGTVETAGHADGFAVASQEGEGAIDGLDCVRVSGEDPGAGFLDGEVVESVQGGVEQVHDALDIGVRGIHAGKDVGVGIGLKLLSGNRGKDGRVEPVP